MIIGIPREILDNEVRVHATPAGMSTPVEAGDTVPIEPSTGLLSGGVPRTTTYALSVVTLAHPARPSLGLQSLAITHNPGLGHGVNCCTNYPLNEVISSDFSLPATHLTEPFDQ